MLNIGFKHDPGIGNYRVWRRVAHVLVIMATNVGAVGAVLIDKPSMVETAPTQQRNVMAKLSDGGLKNCIAGDKCLVDVLRPSGQEGKKFSVDSGAECGASSGTANFVAIAPLNMTDEGRQQQSADDGIGVGKEGFDHWFWKGVARFWAIPLQRRVRPAF